MNKLFKDKEHLVRVALLFVAGLFLFVVARAILVPKGFGDYGHYRAGALADVAARPVAYAGRAACLECHTRAWAARPATARSRSMPRTRRR